VLRTKNTVFLSRTGILSAGTSITKGGTIISEFPSEPALLLALLLAGYLLIFCAEWRRHRINLRFLLFAGATQKVRSLTRAYYAIIIAILPVALIEMSLRWNGSFGVGAAQLAGMSLIAGGVGLRLWTLTTLGAAWTMSCLYWPQMPRIRRGPFRWLRHPEYLSRLMDGVGLCVVLNAFWTAAFAAFGLLILAWLITRVENPDLSLMRDEVIEAEPLGDRGFAP